MWVAVYDILLDWIDPSNRELHPSGYHELLTPTRLSQPLPLHTLPNTHRPISNAYADDLATITTGPMAHAVQEKQAEWISAFCAFTGLQLNMSKIVSVAVGYPQNKPPPHITVFNNQWEPTLCPIVQTPKSLTYLGLTLDHAFTGNSMAAFGALHLKATSMLEHLLDQPGPVPAKIVAAAARRPRRRRPGRQ